MTTTRIPGPAGLAGASGPAGRPASARQETLRESNLALVAQTVCASAEPVSRAGVAALTSLTRSTVSRLVDDLVAGGVLDEQDPAAVAGPGRPATPLVAGSRLAALGLQVNATFLAARVVDLQGRVLAQRLEPGDFVASQPEPTLARTQQLGEQVLAELPASVRLVGAGLALPGVVSATSGHLLLAPNLGWSDIHPAALMDSPALSALPLRVGNEADLAARTVADVAPGRPGPLADFVYLSGEIGIGGAAVVGRQVMQGRHGWAGEIGHVSVDPAGPPCACGSTGCLERYAGKTALLAAAGLPPTATPGELAERARAGEARPRAALAAAAWALGVALAGVVNVLDIPTVVLGGHLGQIEDLLRPDLERHLRARVVSARWVPPTIAAGPADAAPGATGAALLELATVLAHPAPWAGARR